MGANMFHNDFDEDEREPLSLRGRLQGWARVVAFIVIVTVAITGYAWLRETPAERKAANNLPVGEYDALAVDWGH